MSAIEALMPINEVPIFKLIIKEYLRVIRHWLELNSRRCLFTFLGLPVLHQRFLRCYHCNEPAVSYLIVLAFIDLSPQWCQNSDLPARHWFIWSTRFGKRNGSYEGEHKLFLKPVYFHCQFWTLLPKSFAEVYVTFKSSSFSLSVTSEKHRFFVCMMSLSSGRLLIHNVIILYSVINHTYRRLIP